MDYSEQIQKINNKIVEAKGSVKLLKSQLESLNTEKTTLEQECMELFNCHPKNLKEKIESLSTELETSINSLNEKLQEIENDSV
jgi:chromosome segregation ATPase